MSSGVSGGSPYASSIPSLVSGGGRPTSGYGNAPTPFGPSTVSPGSPVSGNPFANPALNGGSTFPGQGPTSFPGSTTRVGSTPSTSMQPFGVDPCPGGT